MNKLTPFLIAMFILGVVNTTEAKEMIAYSHLTGDYWQIWTMNADGTDQKQVTFSDGDKRDPAWLGDGERLAFRTSSSQFFILDLKTGEEKQFLKKYGILNSPSYSGTRNEVVFVRFDPQAADVTDIWKAALGGEDARLLTKDNLSKYQPHFSPDGEHIVFVRSSDDRRSFHLWMMDPEGENPRQLTDGKRVDLLPRISPDNKTVTFSSNVDHNFNIYLMNIKSLKKKRLTDAPGLETDSSFSPDGNRIIFVSNRSGNQQLWTMNTHGGDLKQLTSDANESIDPDWIDVPEKN